MIDAHLHLQDVLESAVLADILRDARGQGVCKFFSNAVNLRSCEVLSDLAGEYDQLVPFYGIHPWEAANAQDGWEEDLGRFVAEPLCGVGEIGLDKAKETTYSKQLEVFLRQLEIAKRYRKPVVIHCVRAWGEMMPILRENASVIRFLMHGFRGSEEILAEIMKLGGYVTFSWKLFHQKYGEPMEKVEQLIKKVSFDRLLLETDFPYIGEKCSASLSADRYFECVEDTYGVASRLLGVSVRELEKQTEKNGKAFLHGAADR